MKNELKNNKGITLVALVITIVVLLILAGVVVGTFTSSGVITKAREAKNQSENSQENDVTTINGYSEYIEEFIPRLPKEYQEVEYLQSSGTQWIDTGYKITTENFKAVFAVGNGTDGKNTFGFMNNSTNTNWFTDWGSGNVLFYIGSSSRVASYTIKDKTDISIETTSNKNLTIKIDGVQTASTSFTGTFLGDVGNFCLHSVGSTNFASQRASTCKSYYCYLYQDGTLVRDLVPCYCKTTVTDVNGNECASGTAGMYDLVNNVFYTNQGTGTFTFGDPV